MSIAVDLRELAERIDHYGAVGFLVTLGTTGPHVVSTRVEVDDDALVVTAGRTTAANALQHPRVTLMWAPTASNPDYCLLVDGVATAGDGGAGARGNSDGAAVLRIVPDRAVLHRMVDAGGDGPSCVTVLDAR